MVVSVVHFSKGNAPKTCILDGKPVSRITSFLLDRGPNTSPQKLSGMNALFSLGTKVYGGGFLFEDGKEKSSSIESLSVFRDLHPDEATRVFPYIGGRELNSSPTHAASRWAINVTEIETEDELDSRFPAIAEILREKVKPERDRLGANPNNIPLKKRWWAYQGHRPNFYAAASSMKRILANTRVGPHLSFAFLPTSMVYADSLLVYLLSSYSAFSCMQSRPHEVWARFFSSSMKDDLRYSASDAFETFPFPLNWLKDSALEAAGKTYYEFRSGMMLQNDFGLTDIYNHFHDPDDTLTEIKVLRELHHEMDRAVLNAYGWDDLSEKATSDFLLDYEEEDGDDPTAKKSKKKKPWRYRWPDEFRDEVLARLLELNEQRAMEEKLAGKLAAKAETKKTAKPKSPKPTRKKNTATPDMFEQGLDRNQRFVLLLLRAWNGKLLTRRALNAGMILMVDDKLRTSLLDNTSARRKSKTELALDQILIAMSTDEIIEFDNTGGQQIVKLTAIAPPTDDAAEEDLERIKAVKEFFRREAEAGNVTETEEIVDAELDLVPA